MTARRALVSAAYVVGIVGVLAFVLIKLHAVPPNFFWREVLNTGHVPLFGMMALASLGLGSNLFGGSVPRDRLYLVALAAAVVLGGASELLQVRTHRDPDLWDYLRDISGAVAALAWYATLDRRLGATGPRQRPELRRALRGLALVALLAGLMPLAVWTEAYRQRTERLPSLIRFDSHLELLFVRTRGATIELARPPAGWLEPDRQRVARVVYTPSKYPSMKLYEPHPDWTGFRHLDLDLFLAGTREAAVVIRIDDRNHNNEYGDRYNHRFILQPGANHIRIPLVEVRDAPKTRQLAMDQIAALLLFAVQPEHPVVLYLADLELSED